MHPDWRRICDDFLTATSYSPDEMDAYWKDRHYDRENRPDTYLTYPDARVRVPLGTPSFPQTPDVWTVLRERRSKRNFLDVPMTLDQLNCLLWGSQGIVRDMGDYQLRTAPSAGALYPIETYLVVNRVEGLEPGLYHLDVRGWALEGIRMGDLADAACAALLDQEAVRASGVTFLWTCVLERCLAKYYERAFRYVWWDVGHISENVSLVATALGLGAVCMGAWYDSLVHELLGIDGKGHFSALTTAVGTIQGDDWLADRRSPPKPS